MIIPRRNSPLFFFILNSNLSSYKKLEQDFIESADKVEIGPDQERIGFVLYCDPGVNPYQDYYISFSDMLYQEFLKSQYGIINRIDSLQYDTEKIKNFIHECLIILSQIATEINKEPILNKDGLYQHIIQLNEIFKKHYDRYLDDEMRQLIIKTSQALKGKKSKGNEGKKIESFKFLLEPQKIDSLFNIIKDKLIFDDGNTQEKFRQVFSAKELTEPLKIRWMEKSLASLFRFIDLLTEIGVIEQIHEKADRAKVITMIFSQKDGKPFPNIGVRIHDYSQKESKWEIVEKDLYPKVKELFSDKMT